MKIKFNRSLEWFETQMYVDAPGTRAAAAQMVSSNERFQDGEQLSEVYSTMKTSTQSLYQGKPRPDED